MNLRPVDRVVFSLFLAAPLIFAQESINFASLGGRVVDSSGAVVEGARITARQVATNVSATTATDREGRFRFPYLKIGPYEIQVQQPGFADSIRSLTLTVGSAYDLPFTLSVASTETQVRVTADVAVLEAARSQIAGTVSQAEVRSLPLNGRNVLDLALLVPGVSPTNTASSQLFAETSAVPGQGISVGSQRNFSNNFIVDGLSANDDAAGLSGVFYSLDVVNEFQVVTSGAQAEFGRALGGYVNIVTRSGSNELHGDAYGYFRNSRLNAANALSHSVLPMTQAQYGVSLSGPVIPNRTFYFVNFEQRDLNQAGLISIAPSNVAAINARLAAVGYPGAFVDTGLFSNPVHNSNVFAKVDHQFSDRDQFSLRYSVYRASSTHSRGAGGLNATSASAGLDNTDQTIALSNVRTFSAHTVNETRAQFTASNLAAAPSDPVGPAVSISGVASFGALSNSPTARRNALYQAADNLSYEAGSHALRAGVDFLYNGDTIAFPRAVRGSYTFSSLANFLSGIYNNSGFTQSFGNSVVSQTNPNAGFYLQDEWKFGSHFTFNLGIRYDLQFLNTIATDTNNVAPRAGFAWSPFASRNTVVRGSFGLFYDRVPLRALANALLSAGNTTDPGSLRQVGVSLSPGQAGAPVFPYILGSLSLPQGVLFNFSTMDRHIQNAYSGQGSFEVEQRIGARGFLSVGYEHLRGLHLIATINQNVPACVALGSNNGCRPNPNYGNNNRYSSAADSNYNGLHVSFLQRPVAWGSLRVSYTYSKALDNVGEFFFSSPIDNLDIWRDYGRSDDDQRHRVVFDGTLHSSMKRAASPWQGLSHGFQLSGIAQYYSALPFNLTTGSNTIQGTAARPIVNGAFLSRNAGTSFDFFNVSARLSRSFRMGERLKLEGMAEAFNVLNHVNGVTLNGTFGAGSYPANPSPAFRQITAVADARSLQLALRFSF